MSDWVDNIQINVPEASDNIKPELEWREERLGMLTASTFSDFVKKDKKNGGYMLSKSEATSNLIYKIVWERLIKDGDVQKGMERLNVSSRSMEHGTDNEPLAIKRYMDLKGVEVDYAQRFVKQSDYIGGTPDGFVGDDGIIEVKCPYNGGNHLRTLMTGEIYKQDYIYQVQGYLMITGRKWCDFVTYDPDMPEGLDISVNRFERDEKIIGGIKMVLQEVIEKLKQIRTEITDKDKKGNF